MGKERFTLYLDTELKEKVRKMATSAGLSINSLIMVMLYDLTNDSKRNDLIEYLKGN